MHAKTILLALLGLTTNAWTANNAPPDIAAMAEFFHHQPQRTAAVKSWVILLPGSSGLTVFGDASHYSGVADALNQRGHAVILVDYKAAYRAAKRRVKESTGEKINWVAEQAIGWARAQGHIPSGLKGGIVGWSLAAEGLIRLAGQRDKLQRLNIASMALFYPSNRDGHTLNSHIPVLIQSGAMDQVTPAEEIQTHLSGDADARVVIYPQAHHGFDIASLKKARSKRFPPLFGKKYTFKYDPAAQQQAMQTLYAWLQDTL